MTDEDKVQQGLSKPRSLVDRASRLVEFLLANVRSGLKATTRLGGYPVALQFVDMPERVASTLENGAQPGDCVFSVPKVSLEPHPRVPRSISEWITDESVRDSSGAGPEMQDGLDKETRPEALHLAFLEYRRTWLSWATKDLNNLAQVSWYENLESCRKRLETNDDAFELVLGTGLLSWKNEDGIVEHPIFTTRCSVVLDKKTARLDVFVDKDASIRLGDRALLEGVNGYHFERTQGLREMLRQLPPRLLEQEQRDLLGKWLELALERHRPFLDEVVDLVEPEETPALSFSPVLIYRPRDKSNLVEYFEQMLSALSGPDAEVPLGLAEMVEPIELEERIEWLDHEGVISGDALGADPLFPLPSNPEQRQIIDRLRFDNGVVVQGPPGTGKTHTIANLLTALLASGQRVLVTSQKGQALRVLRDKLPEEIQALCVSSTDLKRGGSDELDKGVTALSDRQSRFSPDQQRADLARLVNERQAALSAEKVIKEQLRALRESETYVHPEVSPGYAGTKAAIVQRLNVSKDRFAWMPVPLPEDTTDNPPLTAGEFMELLELLRSSTPEREARVNQQFIDRAELLEPSDLREMIAAEVAANQLAGELETVESREIRELPVEVVGEIRSHLDAIVGSLDVLRVAIDPTGWPETWYINAIKSGLSGEGFHGWSQLAPITGEVHGVRDRLEPLGLTKVSLPEFDPDGPGSLAAQIQAGKALVAHLGEGKAIKSMFRPGVQKAAAKIIDGATVDGRTVAQAPEGLEPVLVVMEGTYALELIAERWTAYGVVVETSRPVDLVVADLLDLDRLLTCVLSLVTTRDAISEIFTRQGLRIPLHSGDDLVRLQASVEAAERALDADAATERLQEAYERLTTDGRKGTSAPEVPAMAMAISARDPETYQEFFERYRSAPNERDLQARSDELLTAVQKSHPALAFKISGTADEQDWPGRVAEMPEAWRWARAWSHVDRLREVGLDVRLAEELEQATRAVRRTTAAEAASRAWGECLPRMNAHEVAALKSYRAEVSNYGRGTGKWAGRYAAGARAAMEAARSAVPAWIMPLSQVIDTVKPDKYCFDVVIVDEASQAGIEALFLLWLAPRIIVVGDDRQCAPTEIRRGGNQPVFDRLDEFLPDMPDYLRNQLTPNSNLFTLLSTRFGSMVRLREHFRCMPEIITWSSVQFYKDEKLVPLRQFGADRLAPLMSRYVPGAVTEGSSSKLINRLEAAAIAEQIRECCEDPAYKNKTFGVVVIQSAAQAVLIEQLLNVAVPQDEIESRRIRVGTPPDFQGDERDVMFLSLVVADRASALTKKDWQRRFNVAASRARDQMWLFHSVTPDLLSPKDLRRSLLTYMLNPPAPLAKGGFEDLRWESELQDPFESKFEQRVFIELRDRGYAVTPQFEINGRRIDLLVTGAKGQLAVECDGDHWHSSPEDVQADLDRELELRRAGMKFWRVRESEFYLDTTAAMASLWPILEERGIRPGDLTPLNPDEGTEGSEGWEGLALSDEEGLDGIDGDLSDLDEYRPTDQPRQPRRRRMATRLQTLLEEPTLFTSAADSQVAKPGDEAESWEVRAWATERGFDVGVRGRLSSDVIAAWNREHPEKPVDP